MTVEEYLRTGPVDLSYVAQRMWPDNKNAKVYMSMKLNGKRPFTKKDAESAIEVLKSLSDNISNLTID
ncbi:hypothetical protein TH53_19880 [Pedobacter lusitanus]|uniref:Uncharacterized protein n=1 Tax=Pedobacter lusitanus TaxID=1503925 RepID=A0A0D0GHI9_9SPHI|nr:hypothetical protein [Pedobacter lusitanus]KIO75600.1 hypothetical protein TH53_19880 [Pedobacter lusitanus]